MPWTPRAFEKFVSLQTLAVRERVWSGNQGPGEVPADAPVGHEALDRSPNILVHLTCTLSGHLFSPAKCRGVLSSSPCPHPQCKNGICSTGMRREEGRGGHLQAETASQTRDHPLEYLSLEQGPAPPCNLSPSGSLISPSGDTG